MDDRETDALAAAIAGEELPNIEQPQGSDGAPGGLTSQETEPSPASQEGDKPEVKPGKSEEPKPGGEGGQEDLLKDVSLQVLLAHPTLGPTLQSWNDRSAMAQVEAALVRQRGEVEATASRTADERKWDTHFSAMSQEDVAEEIAQDKDAAVAYAQYQQRQQDAGKPDPNAIARASEVYAYAARVKSVSQLVAESELPAEAKESLNPENFAHLGAPAGIVAWEGAVFTAILSHEADARAQTLLEERWEAYKQEHLAELDGDSPTAPLSRGKRTSNLPDLLSTPSEVLLEDAFARQK